MLMHNIVMTVYFNDSAFMRTAECFVFERGTIHSLHDIFFAQYAMDATNLTCHGLMITMF